jgi:uncharacterized UBP type Zn finger protein
MELEGAHVCLLCYNRVNPLISFIPQEAQEPVTNASPVTPPRSSPPSPLTPRSPSSLLDTKDIVEVEDTDLLDVKMNERFVSFAITPPHDPTDGLDKVNDNTRIPLPNFGNSCYINVIVQILLHDQRLWNSVRHTFGDSPNLLQTLQSLYAKETGIHTFEQCDAVFFLNWILEHLLKTAPTLREMFMQSWCNVYSCKKCQHVSRSSLQQENVWILYPSYQPSQVFQDIGHEFDVRMHDRLYAHLNEVVEKKCDKCTVNTEHHQLHVLTNTPTDLFINLHHFQRTDRILLLDAMSLNVLDNPSVLYTLKGIIVHTGAQHFGHYKIFIQQEETREWWMYNDTVVQPVDIQELAHIVFNTSRTCALPLLWYKLRHIPTAGG